MILGADTGIKGAEGGKDSLRAQERGLHPLDIDAHWLQRKLSKYYEEAMTSQKKATEVLDILQRAADNR